MANDINNFMESVNQFRVYKNGNVLIGITGEVPLPALKGITTTIEGPGILGQIESACIGHYEGMEFPITFRSINNTVEFFNPFENQEICIRGALQCTDPNAKIHFKGFRVVIRGKTTNIEPGKLKQTEGMDSVINIQATYYKIEVDGKTIIELDKWNSVFVVDGQDIMADVRKLL